MDRVQLAFKGLMGPAKVSSGAGGARGRSGKGLAL